MAKSKGETGKRQVSAFLTTYHHMESILTGRDLKAMGLKLGPRYKQILNLILKARLNGEIRTEAKERDLAMKLAS